MANTRLIYDRIRELCFKAATAKDSDALSIMAELDTVIREQVQFLELMIGNALDRLPRRPPID